MYSSKTIVSLLVCLSVVFFPMLLVASDGAAPVVAKVGNIAITNNEVQREMQRIIPMQVSYHGGLKEEKLAEISQEALQTLIERAYKIQYAIAEEIAVDPQSLEKEWQAFRSKHAEKLAKLSRAQVEEYRADIYLSLLAKKAEDVAVDQNISVSEDEVTEYYQNNKKNYSQPKLYTASQVFVRVDPASRKEEVEERRQHAAKLLERVRAGEDFYNLAYYESDDRSKYVGGSLGSFHAGQTVEEFDNALNEMAKGDISGLVRTMYGFHIIKMDDVQEARQLNLEEASVIISSTLKKERRASLYEQWMKLNRDRFPLQLSK